MSDDFWQSKIKAFLNDPPDKAFILFHQSHEGKRDRILSVLGLRYYERIDSADHIASAMQRLDIPEGYRMNDARSCNAHICFKGAFKPVFKHTLSGAEENFEEIARFITRYGYEKALEKYGFNPEIVKGFLDDDWKKTYFSLWRFLPDVYSLGYILPADTRIPDHSIWDHLDVVASVGSCLSGGLGLLGVKISGVQEFIAQSRKLSDLWASSHMFSTIIFEGIKVIVNEMGPDVIIYPQLRGNPMVDVAEFDGEKGKFTLRNKGIELGIIKEEVKNRLYVANFPNTFLVFIPFSKAKDLVDRVEKSIKLKWVDITNKAKTLLEKAGIKVEESLWNSQIENGIEITSAWLEFFNFNRFENVRNEIPADLREKQEKWLSFIEDVERRSNFGHFYFITYEILSAILTQKSRLWSALEEMPTTGKKCLMCGRRSALLLKDEDKNYKVWNGRKWENVDVSSVFEHLLKEGERLCAVCLTKRLYGFKEGIFKGLFEIDPPKQESVVNVAARDFIEKAEAGNNLVLKKIIEKDVELIYEDRLGISEDKIPEEKKGVIEELKKETGKGWKDLKDEVRRAAEQYGKPNKYYAILMMDGDRIGMWLSGERWKENDEERGLANIGEFLHPVFRDKILEWERGKDLIAAPRILTPSHHIAISRAMKDFSLYKVPEIVKKYGGFLVYAGGDDILALFPTDKVLDAAEELQKSFRENFYEIKINGEKRKVMGFGNKASMSAGIVFAHYKWPLYDAIEKVRESERMAKDKYGRNAFCITFIKSSGEFLMASGKWEFKKYFDEIIDKLSPKDEERKKLSHRFIYDFIETIMILQKGGEDENIGKDQFSQEETAWEEPFIGMFKAEVKRLLKRRVDMKKLTEKDVEDLYEKVFSPLIDEYIRNRLSLKDIGVMLKILYDAYRGEEK